MSDTPMIDPLVWFERVIVGGEYARAIDAHKYGEALNNALDQVSDHSANLDNLDSLAKVAKVTASWLSAGERKEILDALTAITQKGELLRQVSGADDLEEVRLLLQEVKAAVDRVERELSTAWANGLTKQFNPWSGVGNLLSTIPSMKKVGEKLVTISNDGLDLQERFPPNSEERKALDKARVALDTAQTSLESSAVNACGSEETGKQVIAFLQATAAGKATLDHLKPAVRDWLKGHQALNQFKIHPVGGG